MRGSKTLCCGMVVAYVPSEREVLRGEDGDEQRSRTREPNSGSSD